MQTAHKIKNDIITFSRRMYHRQLVAANDGNISARTEDGRFWFTPSGICKGDLTFQDLVMTDSRGKQTHGRRNITTECKMHLAIYSGRNDVRAVVHAHPVYATAFATARVSLESCVLPEIITTLGKIPLVNYAAPSTDELANEVGRVMKDHNVCLMANHGIVAAGKSVAEAYYHAERAEHYARILFAAKMLGGEKSLDPEAVDQLRKIQNIYGKSDRAIPDCISEKIQGEPGPLSRTSNCASPDDRMSQIISDIIHQQLKSKGKINR